MSRSVPDPGEVSPGSILVVEDSAQIASLLRVLLTAQGYRVRIVGSMAAARAELASAPADLVILDRGLPDGDGTVLAVELKAGGSYAYVLMLSAFASPQAKLDGFAGGADDYVTKPFMPDELIARVRAGLRIVHLQKALMVSNERLGELATTDSLTGVRNRRWFDDELERSFAQALRYERPMSLAIIDVDHFKSINDRYGHLAGDSVLREISLRASGVLRKSDLIARLGGEEFGVVLPETGLFEGLQVAEKIRAAVSETAFDTGCDSAHVTISAGVASIPHTALARPMQMIWCADQALYRAKNRGRDRVELERRRDPWRPTNEPRTKAAEAFTGASTQRAVQ